MNAKNKEEMEALHERAREILVEFGYATSVRFDAKRGIGDIAWTPTGEILKAEIQKVYDKIFEGRGELGHLETMMLLNIFIHTRHPKPSHET